MQLASECGLSLVRSSLRRDPCAPQTLAVFGGLDCIHTWISADHGLLPILAFVDFRVELFRVYPECETRCDRIHLRYAGYIRRPLS
jgi:hypothetical protein